MNKRVILKALENVPKLLKKHSPEFLTGMGVAGMIITTVTAVKATPKALQLIDEQEIKDGKRLTTKEAIKTTWKCYAPSAATCIASIACIIGASSINAKRNAALAAAYAMSIQDLNDYKSKALEVVGEKKEQMIKDAIAEEKLDKAHVQERTPVSTGYGETLCLEPLTNMIFKSDIESIRRAENNLNKRMRDEMKITVNEFLEELGLDDCDDSIGEGMGWDIDCGYIDLYFTSKLIDGVPYLVVGHNRPPQYLGYI